ncbi:MAG: hypothetical protein HOE90_11975 [Bacteriovoracaceae bacterium]|jgi:hypothetical protein|nr:hypothetical protein [Bacteriovoracaceae bacterium]
MKFNLLLGMLLSLSLVSTHVFAAGSSEKAASEFEENQKKVFSGVSKYLEKGAELLLKSGDDVDLPLSLFGIDDGLFASVTLKLERKVTENRNSTSESDRFLVWDELMVGMKLGVGVVLRGKVSYLKTYTLVRPVGSTIEAKELEQGFTNFSMFKVNSRPMPKNSVLLLEDTVTGGGEVKLKYGFFPSFASVIVKGGVSRIVLRRSILSSKRAGFLEIYKDDSLSSMLASSLGWKVFFVKNQVLKMTSDSGQINRDVYVVALDKIDTDLSVKDAVKGLVDFQDYSAIESVALKQKVSSKFKENIVKFNMMGFLKTKKVVRSDKATITTGDSVDSLIQVDLRKEKKWELFKKQETHIKNVTYSARVDESGLLNPTVYISFAHKDKMTKRNELFNKYLPFINQITGSELISASAVPGKVKKDYGKVNTYVDITVYENGVENLLTTSEDSFWNTLADKLKISRSTLDAQKKYMFKHLGETSSVVKKTFAKMDTNTLWNAEKVVKKLKKAQKEGTSVKRMKALVKAINEAATMNDGKFNIPLITSLLSLAGSENYQLDAMITFPADDGLRLAVVKSVGVVGAATNPLHFVVSDISDLYNLF